MIKQTIIFLFIFSIQSAFSQSKNYTGEYNEKKIKGTLSFKNDETVSGSFYYVSNPSSVYKLSGTNYTDGEVELSIFFKGNQIRFGTLTKTLTDSYIIWEGSMYADGEVESNYLILKRPR